MRAEVRVAYRFAGAHPHQRKSRSRWRRWIRRPQLPDADQAPCPLGSGLAACFTLDQDIVRQQRFKILHDDRDYCRDAYDRAVKRVAGE